MRICSLILIFFSVALGQQTTNRIGSFDSLKSNVDTLRVIDTVRFYRSVVFDVDASLKPSVLFRSSTDTLATKAYARSLVTAASSLDTNRIVFLDKAQTITGLKTFRGNQIFGDSLSVGEASATTGKIHLEDGATYSGTLMPTTLSARREWKLPNESGTIALTSSSGGVGDADSLGGVPASGYVTIAGTQSITGPKSFTGSYTAFGSKNTSGAVNGVARFLNATNDFQTNLTTGVPSSTVTVTLPNRAGTILLNDDSTTIRAYSNALYGRLGSSNYWTNSNLFTQAINYFNGANSSFLSGNPSAGADQIFYLPNPSQNDSTWTLLYGEDTTRFRLRSDSLYGLKANTNIWSGTNYFTARDYHTSIAVDTIVGKSSGNKIYLQDSVRIRGNITSGTSIANGYLATAFGLASSASGALSFASGGNSSATASYSTAMGGSTASGAYSIALGQSTAGANYSTALGQSSANGSFSNAFGGATVNSFRSTAIGTAITLNGIGSFAVALDSTVRTLYQDGVAYFMGGSNSKLSIGAFSPDSSFTDSTGGGHFYGGLKVDGATSLGSLVLGTDLSLANIDTTGATGLRSKYVPYSGANASVNLGAQTFTTTGIASLGSNSYFDAQFHVRSRKANLGSAYLDFKDSAGVNSLGYVGAGSTGNANIQLYASSGGDLLLYGQGALGMTIGTSGNINASDNTITTTGAGSFGALSGTTGTFTNRITTSYNSGVGTSAIASTAKGDLNLVLGDALGTLGVSSNRVTAHIGSSNALSSLHIGQSATAAMSYSWIYNATENSAYGRIGSLKGFAFGANNTFTVPSSSTDMTFNGTSLTFTGAATFSSTISSGAITSSGFIDGTSAITDTSAFTTTATRKAVYISGAVSADKYVVTWRNLAGDEATIPTEVPFYYAKTDSLIVMRSAGTTSGLKFSYIRIK